ncbi:hypothetical protein V3C99_009978 [Haemonchus contortus]
MLITHHSVMPEKLPVTLTFVQWSASNWSEICDMPPMVIADKRYSTAPHTPLNSRKPMRIEIQKITKIMSIG